MTTSYVPLARSSFLDFTGLADPVGHARALRATVRQWTGIGCPVAVTVTRISRESRPARLRTQPSGASSAPRALHTRIWELEAHIWGIDEPTTETMLDEWRAIASP